MGKKAKNLAAARVEAAPVETQVEETQAAAVEAATEAAVPQKAKAPKERELPPVGPEWKEGRKAATVKAWLKWAGNPDVVALGFKGEAACQLWSDIAAAGGRPTMKVMEELAAKAAAAGRAG
jgi:hypothetical protein